MVEYESSHRSTCCLILAGVCVYVGCDLQLLECVLSKRLGFGGRVERDQCFDPSCVEVTSGSLGFGRPPMHGRYGSSFFVLE